MENPKKTFLYELNNGMTYIGQLDNKYSQNGLKIINVTHHNTTELYAQAAKSVTNDREVLYAIYNLHQAEIKRNNYLLKRNINWNNVSSSVDLDDVIATHFKK